MAGSPLTLHPPPTPAVPTFLTLEPGPVPPSLQHGPCGCGSVQHECQGWQVARVHHRRQEDLGLAPPLPGPRCFCCVRQRSTGQGSGPGRPSGASGETESCPRGGGATLPFPIPAQNQEGWAGGPHTLTPWLLPACPDGTAAGVPDTPLHPCPQGGSGAVAFLPGKQPGVEWRSFLAPVDAPRARPHPRQPSAPSCLKLLLEMPDCLP